MFHTKKILNRLMTFNLLVSVGFVALLYVVSPALAATAPSLGDASTFAVLGPSTVSNTGSSVVDGDLGLSPGTAIIGFPPGSVVPPGAIYAADAVALSAKNAATDAYTSLDQACDSDLTGQDLGGLTLTPGVYCFTSSAQLTGTLTLNAEGNAGAVWIFKIGSTLTTASGSSVVFINGGTNCNVFWRVGSSATLGTNTAFEGTIIANESITMNTSATLNGRALALTAAVTLDTNTITVPICRSYSYLGLLKTVSGGTAAAVDFTLTATGDASTGPMIVTGTTPVGPANVPVGIYTLTETGPDGYTSTGFSCDGGTLVGNQLTIGDTDAGNTITCTIANTYTPVIPTSVPTLSEWGMIIFMVLMGLGSIYYLRRRRTNI